jgi:hypothetical protein
MRVQSAGRAATGRCGDEFLIDFQEASLELKVEVGLPGQRLPQNALGGAIGHDIGQGEPEIGVSAVEDLKPAAYGAGRFDHGLGDDARTRAIGAQHEHGRGLGPNVDQISEDGVSRGTSMPSVSHAYPGSLAPIDSGLAPDTRPTFAPMSRAPSATARSMSSCWGP